MGHGLSGWYGIVCYVEFSDFSWCECGCDRDEGRGTRMRMRVKERMFQGYGTYYNDESRLKKKTDNSEPLDIDQRIFISFKPLN